MIKFLTTLLCFSLLVKGAYCFICPSGSYLSSYGNKCLICPAGYSCPGGNRKVRCLFGYYAENSGSISCKICPAGHKCYYVDETPRNCSKGYYQDQQGQTSCKRCKSGEYNVEDGRSTKCNICLVGHRCIFVNSLPIKCSKGYYQDKAGKTFCKRCKVGEYSVDYGSTKCNICPVGHRCNFISSLPIKCPKGYYQDQARKTSCKRCNGGEYNVKTGSSTKCKICPVGYRCNFIHSLPINCSKGYYQDKAGQTSCKRCNGGEYNVEYGRSTKCEICPVGHRCSSIYSLPIKCSKGYYQDQQRQTSCKSCNGGEYNIEYGRSTKCNICPVGHRCNSIYFPPIKCSKGYYQDQQGQTSCKRCNSGEYNLQNGSTKCESCPAGSKCPYIDKVPLPCKKKEYSPAKSVKCFSCTSGSFCPSSSTLPVPLKNDTLLKNKVHSTIDYAAAAYKDKNDTALNGL